MTEQTGRAPALRKDRSARKADKGPGHLIRLPHSAAEFFPGGERALRGLRLRGARAGKGTRGAERAGGER